MSSFLATTLKVLAWISLGGTAVLFLFSLVSESLSGVLGVLAVVVGVIGFLIMLALGLLLEQVVAIKEQVHHTEHLAS